MVLFHEDIIDALVTSVKKKPISDNNNAIKTVNV